MKTIDITDIAEAESDEVADVSIRADAKRRNLSEAARCRCAIGGIEHTGMVCW
jgi:hypothetical protein